MGEAPAPKPAYLVSCASKPMPLYLFRLTQLMIGATSFLCASGS